ncbi:hypothetical protein like AT5G13560 [Hibiscus trionum]|uniref:Uncharacterized protein n=1 Tax=Hibiscus trionum TaxID=183268 RepID=A0A9W7HMN9_HIBTR|nr:hypothetical protein like AT5G13560 [Hibiscus trionum]
MSWLKTAVSKAVEVGNTSITRNIKNYADTVVHHAGQAVAEGAKLFQDRTGSRSIKSLKQTVKRLEEAAISCRGPERAMLLRRWLVALKEIEKLLEVSSEGSQNSHEQILASDEAMENPQSPSVVLYYDSDIGGTPVNFREVFLQSQALEFITISMIIEAPNEEEIFLLQQMFQLCLAGGKEVHNAVISSVQDLASAFSRYQDEVLVKREELLQFVQSAITGLKISADLLRMDSEASDLKEKLSKLSTLEGHDIADDNATKVTIEALKEALAYIRNCSTLEKTLLKKKSLNNGDSPELHSLKVDKLKVLSESLANSCEKAEKRISDNRFQKEETLTARVAKASEAEGKEKEIVAEISVLERRRDELEAELKKVNISLVAANARLRDVREERDQFNEANSEIISHLKMKEDELSKSISACRVEAEVLHTWMNFLEDTWLIQSAHAETKEKQVNEELLQHEDYFVNLVVTLLSDYKKMLSPAINRIGTFVENLKMLNEKSGNTSNPSDEDSVELSPRKHLEEEYLGYEAKIITTLSVVDSMKEQFYKHNPLSRKGDPKVKELFNDIEKLRAEFDAIERPTLEIETPNVDTRNKNLQTTLESTRPKPEATKDNPEAQPLLDTATPESTRPKPEATKDNPEAQLLLDPAAELAKLESEFGKGIQDYSADEIGDWEFDELERELRSGDTTPHK